MNFNALIKTLTLLSVCVLFSVVFAAYLGGRLMPLIDRFYVETDYWGKIDCFEFECMNGSCLFCLNGVYRSGLVYVASHQSPGSNGGFGITDYSSDQDNITNGDSPNE
ncbi:MAG: hypothetical protein WC307_05020 [Candidatus Nanoarchaeia archaeon]|jgi:hypothetical protein